MLFLFTLRRLWSGVSTPGMLAAHCSMKSDKSNGRPSCAHSCSLARRIWFARRRATLFRSSGYFQSKKAKQQQQTIHSSWEGCRHYISRDWQEISQNLTLLYTSFVGPTHCLCVHTECWFRTLMHTSLVEAPNSSSLEQLEYVRRQCSNTRGSQSGRASMTAFGLIWGDPPILPSEQQKFKFCIGFSIKRQEQSPKPYS